MYSQKVIKHFTNPKFVGEIKDADAVGQEGNMKCGDIMKIYLKVKKNKIVDVRFQTYGCGAAIASTDVLCSLIKGKTIEEAKKLTFDKIIKRLGVMPQIKIHCSVLGIGALQNAIADYEKRNKKGHKNKVK